MSTRQATRTLTGKRDNYSSTTRETYSLQEIVAILQEDIKVALDRGYSYREIAAMLADKEIVISAAALRRYLKLSRKTESGQTGRTRFTEQLGNSEILEDTLTNKGEQKITASFLRTARNLQLEGPGDWSVNIEKYL